MATIRFGEKTIKIFTKNLNMRYKFVFSIKQNTIQCYFNLKIIFKLFFYFIVNKNIEL